MEVGKVLVELRGLSGDRELGVFQIGMKFREEVTDYQGLVLRGVSR